ncbi:AAA family ATPase [Lactococcus garvieae]|uniref:AAA family ATPase n=1 Tax=Lactococcus garvieae TaxID=1363 RepID=UPI00254DF7BD|nr:AAA family ATPase [Lactococcus garvieae]
MESIELENLRAIRNSGEINLNNLNLFLGANSTGKSTILRFFPLIKQTLIRDNDSPLLWYDPEGVDFGSFDESIYSRDKNNHLSYKFGFKNIDLDLKDSDMLEVILGYHIESTEYSRMVGGYHRFFPYRLMSEINSRNIIAKVSTKITINKDKYTKITVFIDNAKIEFDMENSEIKVCDRQITPFLNRKIVPFKRFQGLIPEIAYRVDSEERKREYLQEIICKKLASLLFEGVDTRLSVETKIRFLLSLKYYDTKKEFGEHISKKTSSVTLKRAVMKNLDDIYDCFSIMTALFAIREINQFIHYTYSNISYIAPVRATAERYYRVQGLSVIDVDSMGNNVPMILNSMKTREKNDWKKWTKDNFDMEFDTKQQGGHTAINVIKNSAEMYNLADTGFGYSQILPVLLVIWKKMKNRNGARGTGSYRARKKYGLKKIIIIEQPELHLHPAMQAKVADIFVEIIKKHSDIQFIIETHSVVIMDRIGQHIELGNIASNPINLEEKINVFLVNPLTESNQNIIPTSYNSEGIIEEWPVGFLSGGIL